MATKHNSGQQNTYLQAKQTRQVATREVQTKQTSFVPRPQLQKHDINIFGQIAQRDEVTEGQGRRNGPVVRI